MTAAARSAIRAAIDQAKRDRLIRAGLIQLCPECSNPIQDGAPSPNCKRCWHRERRRLGIVVEHGTGGYAAGCRCEDCRLAVRDYRRSWRARQREQQVAA